MDFFTKVTIPASNLRLDWTKKLFFCGSCFADNISRLFENLKFNVCANPFGTLYNPLSIEKFFKNLSNKKKYDEEDVFEDKIHSDIWHSWWAHSELSENTSQKCIDKLNEASFYAFEFLKRANVVFITLGSAYVYFLKETGNFVSNCHRQNPSLFERRMISVEEAYLALSNILLYLEQIKVGGANEKKCGEKIITDKLNVIFTVSPIRHWSDGAHENNLSKSTLQLAVNRVIQEFRNSNMNVEYFPSYEIVMDELRDYRFYKSDMIHLSDVAEEYIFERMIDSFCDKTVKNSLKKIQKFMKSVEHKIVSEKSLETLEFAKKMITEANLLENEISGINLSLERKKFELILLR